MLQARKVKLPSIAHHQLQLGCAQLAVAAAGLSNEKRFGMARVPIPECCMRSRTQTTRYGYVVAYLGLAAQTPLLLSMIEEMREQTTIMHSPQLQQLAPHLRVVSKREIGKKLPYPAEWARWQLSMYLRAEPLSVSGTH